MNVVLIPSQIDMKNIIFSNIKKNLIIQGNFTKILYSDENVVINEMCVLISLKNNENKQNDFQEFIEMEKNILNSYKCEMNIQKVMCCSLAQQIHSGKIKTQKMKNTLLKISGIWENAHEFGMNYKIIFT